MTVNIPVTQDLPIETALTILNMESSTGDPAFVLSSFKKMWDDNPQTENLILAKNTILRYIVSQQMKDKRYFSIISPFEKSCISCRGTGEIYKFNKKPADVRCPVCLGTKKVNNATCSRCLGKGKIKKVFYDHNLKSTTPCKKCNGLGFVAPRSFSKQPFKSKTIGTPVISSNTADALSKLIKK